MTEKTTQPNSASAQKVDANGNSFASTQGHKDGGAAAPATAAKAPKAPKAPKAEGEGKRGRVSQFSGMKLKPTVETNVRREGSHGHKSLQLIIAAGKDGILYEDYIAKGGRLNDLSWDIDKGNVTAEKVA